MRLSVPLWCWPRTQPLQWVGGGVSNALTPQSCGLSCPQEGPAGHTVLSDTRQAAVRARALGPTGLCGLMGQTVQFTRENINQHSLILVFSSNLSGFRQVIQKS